MIESKKIKHALLKYWRFKRSYFVGTEVWHRYGISDIMAISRDLKSSYEVEIKISISDLKSDFKKIKHNGHHEYETNYFYFCVPEHLYEKAFQIIEGHNKNFGIMIYRNIDIALENRIEVKNRGKKLNNNNNERIYYNLVKRLNSELINYYDIEYKRHQNQLGNIFEGGN